MRGRGDRCFQAGVGVPVRVRPQPLKETSGSWPSPPCTVSLQALAEGVKACGHCRPDAGLGFIES
ncbi:hypothetical protein GCM10014715_74600 [Streptomyces spiralis]|uniref:Uncharacterized protein n=1 Tax=Streptomyces spiralis TaxID=66376 RepID=A0A919AIG4_9ACTN|nr:hypothetical protein GCM10014715_74600 [Streptomyces spiralis]